MSLQLPVKSAAWKGEGQLMTILQGSGSKGSALGKQTSKTSPGREALKSQMMKPLRQDVEYNPGISTQSLSS